MMIIHHGNPGLKLALRTIKRCLIKKMLRRNCPGTIRFQIETRFEAGRSPKHRNPNLAQ